MAGASGGRLFHKLVLRAIQEADDIGPVADDDEDGDHGGDDDVQPGHPEGEARRPAG